MKSLFLLSSFFFLAQIPTTVPSQKEMPKKQAEVTFQKLEKELVAEKRIQIRNLSNGLVHWCVQNPFWKLNRVIVSIQAGSSSDPKGLEGRARFVAEILRHRLLFPKSPSFSRENEMGLPLNFRFTKQWIHIEFLVSSEKMDKVWRGLKKALQKPIELSEMLLQKESLIHTTSLYPPTSFQEMLENHLYKGSSFGVSLRGKRKTFERVQRFALQSALDALFYAKKIKVFSLGPATCPQQTQSLQEFFGELPKEKKKDKSMVSPIQSNVSNLSSWRPATIQAYALPSLEVRHWVLLKVISEFVRKEIQHRFFQQYKWSVPVSTFWGVRPSHGYIAWKVPGDRLGRKEIQSLLVNSVGSFLLSPQNETLRQRILWNAREIEKEYRSQMESSQGFSQWYHPQLLLASSGDIAYSPLQTIQKTTPESLRTLGLSFYQTPISSQSNVPVPSLQKIVYFVGALFLLWFLLSTLLRKPNP